MLVILKSFLFKKSQSHFGKVEKVPKRCNFNTDTLSSIYIYI